ncbi:hypothetical protein B0H67DRAFT_647553 [Lasiosphaeris hirsuta]|uniref:Uncharacterized protein n=1 Tax=Lasiosphaeris hirsuta TaxID=260670 RepID=A0AA40DN65_9PEZI|nr:hypothetical protein B0H67DRAFT_647553 [Lasiosphaeris hirsuta]
MIQISRELEEFTLSLGGLLHMDGGSPGVHAAALGRALGVHKATLRVLDLDIEASAGRWIPRLEDEFDRLEEALSVRPDTEAEPWAYGLTAGSLREFAALTHLGIPVQALLGAVGTTGGPGLRLVGILPPNLESLRLYDYVKGRCAAHDELIAEFVEARARSGFARLVEVVGVDETHLL